MPAACSVRIQLIRRPSSPLFDHCNDRLIVARRSETDLTADLEQPRVQDLERSAPARTVTVVVRPYGIGVQRIVDVEVELHLEPVDLEILAQPEIEGRDPSFEQRP